MVVRRKPPPEPARIYIERGLQVSDEASRTHHVGVIAAPVLLLTSRMVRYSTRSSLVGWEPFISGQARTVRFPGGHLELIRHRASSAASAVETRLRELDGAAAG
jgi:surfactin synthase thioesterase subunit